MAALAFAMACLASATAARTQSPDRAQNSACGQPPHVTLDIGHSPKAPGAISARGKAEYVFNRRLAHELADALKAGGIAEVAILNGAGEDISLRRRAALAGAVGKGILLSIHHDSAQPRYLEDWTFEGRRRRFSNRFSGYSLFVADHTRVGKDSTKLALAIGGHLTVAGFKPSLHHAEKIPGEGRLLLDPAVGLYRFGELAVLKSADVPAVLIEAGVIVNQDEELELEKAAYRARLIAAILRGIQSYCGLLDRAK